MSNTLSTWLDYAHIQMAAEAFLIDEQRKLQSSGQNLANRLFDPGNNHSLKFTQTEANDFAAKYEVLDQNPNTGSGFSGTLIKNIKTGELTISFRSTEFVDDALADSVGTNEGIAQYGWAFGQIKDMEELWTPLQKDHPELLDENKGFTVTGYSLGAHLAAAFAQLRAEQNPKAAGGIPALKPLPAYVKHIYTFNGAGTGGLKNGVTLTDAMQVFTDVINNGMPSWLSTTERTAVIAQATSNQKKILDEKAAITGFTSGVSGDGTTPLVPRPGLFADYNFNLAMAVAGTKTTGAFFWNDPRFWNGTVPALFDPASAPLDGMRFDQMTEILGSGLSAVAVSGFRHSVDRYAIRTEDQPLLRGEGPRLSGTSPRLNNEYAKNDFADTHSMTLMIDSLAVADVFSQFAADSNQIDNGFINSLINATTNTQVETNKGDQGKAEGDVLETLVDKLYRLVNNGTASALLDNKTLNNGGTWADQTAVRTPLLNALHDLSEQACYVPPKFSAEVPPYSRIRQEACLSHDTFGRTRPWHIAGRANGLWA